MKEIDTTFFQGKRPWSKIKDKVLRGYMPAYLNKIKELGRPILLIDGYAGPGIFSDGGTGSPLIMCESAEQHVPDKYQAIFVNYNRKHHQTLEDVLIEKGWRHKATPILGDSTAFLAQLSEALSDQTLFVYLDPFGLRGCEFSTLEPFLTRSKTFSTEIVLNVSMPITHRLASANKVAMGKADDPRIVSYHQRMTAVFGGDYWKDIYFSDLTAEDKEFALIQGYQQRIARYLPYTGSCPVREDSKSRVK
jgi:three-Cys-motif partner protein